VIVRRLFLSQGILRPIWRFFLSVGAIVCAVVVVQTLLGLGLGVAGIPPNFFLSNALSALLTFPALLGMVGLFERFLDHKPRGSAGIAFQSRWRAELGIGLAVGAVMILAVAAIEWALGAVQFSWSEEGFRPLLIWGAGLFVVLAFAATNEEMIFRGYPFQRLVDSIGAVAAIVTLSALFGAIHLGNPNHTWVATINTALVGIPFSIAYLRTRMLWLPIGMHFAWNFIQGFLLGLPVSGIRVPVSLLRADVTGSKLLTGGDYGPEAGLLATGMIVVATGYLAFTKSIYVSAETRALVFGPAVAPVPEPIALGLSESKEDSGPAAPE
jgi:membrane protease YdiL (CAAX protease family)